jgi:hypothetical protein
MKKIFVLLLAFAAILMLNARSYAIQKIDTIKIDIDWNKTDVISKTTPTLQLVENPRVRQADMPVHAATFKALKNLGADMVRYVPWFPYPKLVVAELDPPANGKTSWDFTLPDSTMAAFMEATKGHSVVINFSTTPAWMWKTDKPVTYPANPYQLDWDYNQGTQLRDTTAQQLAGYYARIMSWYTKGGFTDELGKYHKSGHYYKIPYWEVLNEVDAEHSMSPQTYTKIYDAIVTAMHKVSPDTKFIGLALAYDSVTLNFLNTSSTLKIISRACLSMAFLIIIIQGHPTAGNPSARINTLILKARMPLLTRYTILKIYVRTPRPENHYHHQRDRYVPWQRPDT